MTGAVRNIPSQPLCTLAPKTASGGKIRAHRIAPERMPRNRLYRLRKTQLCGQTRIGAHILANTIGNAIAGGISGSQDTSAQVQQVGGSNAPNSFNGPISNFGNISLPPLVQGLPDYLAGITLPVSSPSLSMAYNSDALPEDTTATAPAGIVANGHLATPGIQDAVYRIYSDANGSQIDGAGNSTSDNMIFAKASSGVNHALAYYNSFPHTEDPLVYKWVANFNAMNGATPGDTVYLDPDLIRAQIMVESGSNLDAYTTDPLQVNKNGDWDGYKGELGLVKGQSPGADLGIKYGLEWLDSKSYLLDAKGDPGAFIGYNKALARYNGGGNPNYVQDVMRNYNIIKQVEALQIDSKLGPKT